MNYLRHTLLIGLLCLVGSCLFGQPNLQERTEKYRITFCHTETSIRICIPIVDGDDNDPRCVTHVYKYSEQTFPDAEAQAETFADNMDGIDLSDQGIESVTAEIVEVKGAGTTVYDVHVTICPDSDNEDGDELCYETPIEYYSLSPSENFFENGEHIGNEVLLFGCYIVKSKPRSKMSYDAKQGASVYPNPSNGPLTIETSIDGQLMIQSASGQIIYSKNITAGMHRIQDIHLSKGLYLIDIVSENERYSEKILILD